MRKVAQKRKVITVRNIQAKITKRVKAKIKMVKKALEQGKVIELKKENIKIAAHKKLQKQLHKKLKAYLKVQPALAYLLK